MAKKNTATVTNIEEGMASKKKAAPSNVDEKGRVRLPPLPRAGKKQKPQKECECGCQQLTRSRYVPGHDSYLRGWVLRVERKIVKISEVPEQHQAAVKREMKARAAKANEKPAADAPEVESGNDEGAAE